MSINLAILYGIDDKFSIVEKTIERCNLYFQKIFIINTGGSYTEQKLKKINCSNLTIYNQEFLWGDTDSSRRYALNLCEDGDWMFWLDSDECPTKILLENLNDIISKAEIFNCGNIRFPSSNHLYYGTEDISKHNPYKSNAVGYPYDVNISLQKETFLFNRMLKKIKGAYFLSSCGGHSQFGQHTDFWIYSNYPINHYKSNKTACISAVLHTWTSMRPNFTKYKDIVALYDSEEFKIHSTFKKENSVENVNKLVNKLLNDVSFKDKIKECYYTDLFKNSHFHYRAIYEWIDQYDLDITNDDGNYLCELECCKY